MSLQSKRRKTSANRRITYLRNRDSNIYVLRYVMALQLKRIIKIVVILNRCGKRIIFVYSITFDLDHSLRLHTHATNSGLDIIILLLCIPVIHCRTKLCWVSKSKGRQVSIIYIVFVSRISPSILHWQKSISSPLYRPFYFMK